MPEPFKFIPIPRRFFQEAEQVPFTHCNVCDRQLEEDTLYLIEKAFQTYLPYKSRDVVFEYAICFDCYESLSESFSDESRKAMENYIDQRVDVEERAAKLLADDTDDVDGWLTNCFISDEPVSEMDGYQLVGVFVGSDMMVTHTPCAIGSAVISEIVDLLSKKTIDILGGFAKDVLPQPPGSEKDVPSPVLVI